MGETKEKDMNFRLFLAVEWGRAVGVKLECVRLVGGGSGVEAVVWRQWVGGCCSQRGEGSGWLAGWLLWRHPVL